ncbi:hypothetical protein U6B65_05830 [Oscillospiraceae bacterium MB08-C2-2]|nr:hypothetical protein U6B65_05830 [Oscillospiraceae bacterium MB08-C2-2]
MSYNEKTAHYNLPQWKPEDKPSRQDFNEAYAGIDTTLANKAEKATTYSKMETDSLLANKVNLDTVEWITLSLQNGVTVAGGLSPRYCKVYGIVYLQGMIVANTLQQITIGTLPEGYRPSEAYIMSYISNNDFGNSRSGNISATAGTITIYQKTGGSATDQLCVQCCFPAAQ